MRALAVLLIALTVTACGAGVEPVAEQNDTRRITGDIERQRQMLERQAANGAAAIERALENEGAAIFENRAALLNQTTNNQAAASGNRSR